MRESESIALHSAKWSILIAGELTNFEINKQNELESILVSERYNEWIHGNESCKWLKISFEMNVFERLSVVNDVWPSLKPLWVIRKHSSRDLFYK